MRAAIYGAGSMGTILGAFITKKGGQIELINRNMAHVEALRTKGATVCGTVDFVQPVTAYTPDKMSGKYDVIFLLTKQLQNAEVASYLKGFLAEDGVVVTLQNGIPELLIGAAGAEYGDDSMIYDLFTLEEGTPVRVLVSSARVRYYLCEDDRILHEGSGGASYNLSLLYDLEGSRLALAAGIVMADTRCFVVYEDRESLFSERRQSDREITREEYFDIMNKLETLTVPLDLVPIL